jgi:hypothetical protein
MALFRTNDVAKAREHLDIAREKLAGAEPPPGQPCVYANAQWHDWLVCKLLVKEAERLNGQPDGNRRSKTN